MGSGSVSRVGNIVMPIVVERLADDSKPAVASVAEIKRTSQKFLMAASPYFSKLQLQNSAM